MMCGCSSQVAMLDVSAAILDNSFKTSTLFIDTVIMYKTAVYTLVNGVIRHQKQQISKNVILRSMTLPKCQCTAAQYHLFW